MSLASSHNVNTGKFTATATGHKVSKKESEPTLSQREHIVEVLSRNPAPTALLVNGTNDMHFEIPSDALDYLDQAFLTYSITNSDGANASALVDGFANIEYVSVFCNDVEVQTVYGHSLRNNYLATKDTQKIIAPLATIGISSTTFASTIALAASASTTVYVPISCILDRAQIPLWRKEAKWRLSFKHLTGAQLMMAASVAVIATQTVDSYKLFLTGRVLDEKVRQLHDYELEVGGAKSFRYLNQARTDISLGNITSGTATTVNVTTPGRVCYYWLHVQAAAGVGASLYSSTAITSFDLMNSSKPIISDLGTNNYLTAFLKAHSAEHWTATALFSLLNVYYQSFSDKPQEGLEHGANHGSFFIDGSTSTIRIVPGANVTSASLKMYAHCYSDLTIDFLNKSVSVNRNSNS